MQEKQQAAGNLTSVLPEAEMEAVTRGLAEVLELAADGQVADGYELLLWGLRRAQAVRDRGVPWGEELVTWWRLAVENYTNRYPGLFRR
jgi:hypothetical protein